MPIRRRALLDENIDVRFARELRDVDISTVRAEGWSGVTNGKLLRLVETNAFEVFITADRNLEHQQTLGGRPFGTVVLLPKRLKLDHLLPLTSALLEAIASVGPGEVVHVRAVD